jgi:hypothetical protein
MKAVEWVKEISIKFLAVRLMVYNACCIKPDARTKFRNVYVVGTNKHRSKSYFDVEHTDVLCQRVPFYLQCMPSVRTLQDTNHMF